MMAELLLKGSAVLAVTALAVFLLRHAAAATRHLVWSAGVAAAVALPLFAAVLPAVPLLPPALAARASAPVESAPHAGDLPLALLVWIGGTIAMALRAAVGDLHVRRLAARARPVTDREWLRLFEEARGDLGLARRVRLLASSEISVPVTFGMVSPVVLVPADVRGWPERRKRFALLHELAHVERFDAVTQILARLACALHWPNPLAHLAARAMRIERERACDDRVLACGAMPSEYADDLLQIACEARGPALALEMSRPSRLEGRLLWVLDPRAPRGRATSRSALAACSAALCLSAPLASMRAEPAPADPQGPEGVFEDVRQLQCDSARAQLLQALMERQSLTPAQTREAIDLAARRISIDEYKSNVLVALARKRLVESSMVRAYLEAAASIHSERERGRALSAIATR